MLAAIRPDSWNYALFLHVLGAMILVGALVTAGTVQVLGMGRGPAAALHAYARLAFRTLLFVGVPAWFVMRIGAEWIYSKEKCADVRQRAGAGSASATSRRSRRGRSSSFRSYLAGLRRSAAGYGPTVADDARQVGGRARARRARRLPRRPLGDDREARLGTVTP